MSERYQELKKQYIKGWRTWNVRSVLSHVHMPDGFALNVAFKEYRDGHYLKETVKASHAGAGRRLPLGQGRLVGKEGQHPYFPQSLRILYCIYQRKGNE